MHLASSTLPILLATLAAPAPRPLNNLVIELLETSAVPAPTGTTIDFANPRDGWVFISTTPTASPAGTVAIMLDSDPEPLHTHTAAGTIEAMRLLPAGPHRIAARGPGGAPVKLLVRAVPELVYSKFGADPHVHEYGKYDWPFLSRYVLPNLNVLLGTAAPEQGPQADQWRRRGRRWMVECGVPGLAEGETVTADQAAAYWLGHPGLTDPMLDGVVADEFYHAPADKYAAWTRALDRVRAEASPRGKRFYPYCTSIHEFPAGRAFIRAVMDAGWHLALERYLPEQRTEAQARAFIRKRIGDEIEAWDKAVPGSPAHVIICLGTFSQPPESLDVDPAVDLKVYLDMQMNLLANDPACRRLAGVMTYLSSYTDEETVRWMGRLFRHYGIEGRTEPYTSDPYALTHVANPDFEEGLNGWAVDAAAPETVAVRTIEGLSWLQGRYPKTRQGDTALCMRRSASRPNLIRQTIRDLKPGRLYSVRMYSADAGDLGRQQKHALRIRLSGAELLPHQSFQHVFPNCYSHHHGPYDQNRRAWFNYHWLVFRAAAPQALLEISDWLSPEAPGGPAGQEIAINFVQIQPYLPPDPAP